jgi:RNA polymerase sigma-70 factor (ECF subfamily)
MLGNEDDALDAAQDVFVQLVREAKRLRGLYPSSLLYTMATNICLNRIRWKSRHAEISHDGNELSLFSNDRGFDLVEARMIMDTIMSTESESTRTICFMYHADGMTLKEIGEAMGMSVSGVRKRLVTFSARARITYEGENRS